MGHLAPSISADFTTGMVHAFLTSVLICALAIVCSLMRGGRQSQPTASPSQVDDGAAMQPAGRR